MDKLDFLGVGDVAVDTFIRIKDASVHCELNREHCELCLSFGDKVPYEFLVDVAGTGNSPNASVAAAKLGLSSGVVTDIGNDESGKECKEALEKSGVKTDFLRTHDNLPTNRHFVLWYEDERTILVNHTEFPYSFPNVLESKWMYLSSIGSSDAYHAQIADYLDAHKDIKLAFQPGTFQILDGYEKMKRFYERAEVIAINMSEAQKIVGANLGSSSLLEEIHERGPKIVVITDGKDGSYLFDGNEKWHMPVLSDSKPPYERTGAGDAATATFVSAIHLGKDPIEALKWGHINSHSVIQEVGALKGQLSREQIEEKLKSVPSDFSAVKIS